MRFLIICALVVLGMGWDDGVAAPLSGAWQTRLLLVLEGPQSKIALPPFAVESIVRVHLNLSGLQIRALTAASTVGLEAQAFTLSFTVGALTLTDIFLFARNIVEADQNFQIRFVRPDPGGVVGQYLPTLYKDLVTPYAQLALLLGPTLTEPVTLRKKIVEAQMILSGVTIKAVGLLANFGSAGAPQWEGGAVLTLRGQTVSGVTVQSSTYIGARRGFACVGECIPELQFAQGRVVSGWEFEYERLTVSGVRLWGMTANLDVAVNLNGAEGSMGIEYLQITSSFRVEPLALDVTDILYLNSNLVLSSHTLMTGWSVGEAFVTAIWTDTRGGISFALREFITSVSLGAFSVTSDVLTCAGDVGCSGLAPIYEHDLQLVFKNSSWRLDVLLVFLGLLKPFDKFVLAISYTEKSWGWRAGTAIQPSGLKVQEFYLTLSF